MADRHPILAQQLAYRAVAVVVLVYPALRVALAHQTKGLPVVLAVLETTTRAVVVEALAPSVLPVAGPQLVVPVAQV